MFRKGGAAFPDLSGDGKVTQKDILMGRGVIPMQEGGMMPPAPEMMMPPSPDMMMAAAPPPAPPPDMMMAPEPATDDAAGLMGLQAEANVDPAMLEQLLTAAAGEFGDLESAEDYEGMINMLRGDEASLGERRSELAEMVGPEDAQQTPESVLALVQPVIMMTQGEVDQGIGSIAQGLMSEPVAGDMAGGIMSTIDMAGAQEAPAPVNFNQGGAVQHFAPENPRVVGENFFGLNLMPRTDPEDLRTAFTERRDLYRDLIPPVLDAEELAEQKRLSQAQMLFDIANAGLAIAQPGKESESLVQAIARGVGDTKLFDKIGARAQQQRQLETQAKMEDRKIDLAALSSAEAIETARQKAIADARKEKPDYAPGLMTMFLTREDGTEVEVPGYTAQFFTRGFVNRASRLNPNIRFAKVKDPTTSTTAANYFNMFNPAGKGITLANGTEIPARILVNSVDDAATIEKLSNSGYVKGNPTEAEGKPDFQTLQLPFNSKPVTLNGKEYKPGDLIDLDVRDLDKLQGALNIGFKLTTTPTARTQAQVNANDLEAIMSGKTDEERSLSLYSGPLLSLYASGELDKLELVPGTKGMSGFVGVQHFNSRMTRDLTPRQILDKETATVVTKPRIDPTDELLAAIASRKELGLPVPNLERDAPKDEDLLINPADFDDEYLSGLRVGRFEGAEVFDPTTSYAMASGIRRFTNLVTGQLESFGIKAGRFDGTSIADKEIREVLLSIGRTIREDVAGRAFASDVNSINQTLEAAMPGVKQTAAGALDNFRSLRESLVQATIRANKILAEPGGFGTKQKQEARAARTRFLQELGTIQALINMADRQLNPTDPAGRQSIFSGATRGATKTIGSP